jgi:hypothetical protein
MVRRCETSGRTTGHLPIMRPCRSAAHVLDGLSLAALRAHLPTGLLRPRSASGSASGFGGQLTRFPSSSRVQGIPPSGRTRCMRRSAGESLAGHGNSFPANLAVGEPGPYATRIGGLHLTSLGACVVPIKHLIHAVRTVRGRHDGRRDAMLAKSQNETYGLAARSAGLLRGEYQSQRRAVSSIHAAGWCSDCQNRKPQISGIGCGHACVPGWWPLQ